MVGTQPDSVVASMRAAFAELAPEVFKDAQQMEAAKYKQAERNKADAARNQERKHVPDTYVDADKRKNLEKLFESQKNFSHKPFVIGNPPLEREKHGGWEGTFAARHGGFPHMYENLAPSKSKRWLGEIDTKPLNTLPILVPYAKQGGPGFPNRAICGEIPYESDANFDQVEKLNRALRLGYGAGFRPDNNGQVLPWRGGKTQIGAFDGMAAYQPVEPPHSASRAARRYKTTGRARHERPFMSAAAVRRLPTEAFMAYAYMPEPYVDDTHKYFDLLVKERLERLAARRGAGAGGEKQGTQMQHPPFRPPNGRSLFKTSPSILFRRRG